MTILTGLFAFLVATFGTPGPTAAEFNEARVMAVQAAGTSSFAATLELERMRCDRSLDRMIACKAIIAETVTLDAAQRAYDRNKTLPQEPPPPPAATKIAARTTTTSAPPAKATSANWLEDDGEEDEAPVAHRVRTFGQPESEPAPILVDVPNGYDHVASLSMPAAPWTGMRVWNLGTALPGVQRVCVMKDGAPLPIGSDVPFSFSHERGADVFACPAGIAMVDGVYAPAGSTILLAKYDPARQVYVVEKAATCDPPSTATGRVANKSVTACVPLRVQ